MSGKIGISGSTILSDEKHFQELMADKFEFIEIGEFKDNETFFRFLALINNYNKKIGIHSPLLKGKSKYDLVEKNLVSPDIAFNQLEDEAKFLKKYGANYLLVHFPYFSNTVCENFENKVDTGLERLAEIKAKFGIDIVVEPKLGIGRSSCAIEELQNLSSSIFENYGIKLCIDLGDYILSFKEETKDFIRKWLKSIKVVHLHDIVEKENKYYWIPINPKAQYELSKYVLECIEFIANNCIQDIIYVFEHTPHINYAERYFEEGYIWLKNTLN